MKKSYKIEVDCANCANLMEQAAKKTPGVADAKSRRERERKTGSRRGRGMCQLLEMCGKCKNGPSTP